MQIREFRETDLEAAHRINEACVPAVGAVTREALAHICQQSAIALVAESGEREPEVIGFCLVLARGARYASKNYAWFSERYDDFIYLDRVALAPTWRGQGIGRSMYDAVGQLAPRLDPRPQRITLEVNIRPRNEPSLAFHARMGFVEVGERETEYGTRVALMQKLLAGSESADARRLP